MSPYVTFQEQVIRILSGLVKKDQDFLKRLAEECRKQPTQHLETETLVKLISLGLEIPNWCSWSQDNSTLSGEKILIEIILQQVDDSGSEVVIRNLLGTKLYDYGPPLNLKEFIQKKGSGECRLRTNFLAQPGALKKGDILADGSRVLSEPRDGGNGSVLLHLTGGFDGAWISVPARIPIALLTKEDEALEGLIDE